ncbi:relaxase/mobilization nuclease domain-containing protein [Sphingomonas sp. LY160]|uniref:relaxase/mobilization nuclease domain-containing protein n=1 Tax=Sphingomonas sp. LY160 TaxID=3095342 RepID=UPI002ADEE52F|nr:hypothetical protein [Sphingomonas sp. LY160]MEA1071756.1 hypothetical protein [Sphingomonas sp. LY160]
MIIKLIQGQDFSGLNDYLTHAREHRIISCRGVSAPEAAAEEMALVAAERPDVFVPALHAIFACAPEDREKMTDPMWSELTDAFEAEFGLSEHQKFEVEHPHPDKRIKGPHRHGGYNKVHPLTFRLPSKGRDERASWDTAAKHRAWMVADAFAVKYNLTRVADPTKVEAAGRVPNHVRKREAYDGVLPVAEFAEHIRDALRQPDWDNRILSLAAYGLEVRPICRRGLPENGEQEIAGIRIVDVADPKNFQKASAFGREFGYSALEKSRSLGSPTLSEALGNLDREELAKVRGSARKLDARAVYHMEFERDLDNWNRQREESQRKRKKVLQQQQNDRRKLAAELRSERSEVLADVPQSLHAHARKAFQLMKAAPRQTALADRHREQLLELKIPPRPTWSAWLDEKSQAGDTKAADLLQQLSSKSYDGLLRANPPADISQPAARSLGGRRGLEHESGAIQFREPAQHQPDRQSTVKEETIQTLESDTEVNTATLELHSGIDEGGPDLLDLFEAYRGGLER